MGEYMYNDIYSYFQKLKCDKTKLNYVYVTP